MAMEKNVLNTDLTGKVAVVTGDCNGKNTAGLFDVGCKLQLVDPVKAVCRTGWAERDKSPVDLYDIS